MNRPSFQYTYSPRWTTLLILAVCIQAVAGIPPSHAASSVETSIHDTVAYPGQELHLPIRITTLADTVEAFELRYSLDRPDLAFFSRYIADTQITCANAPACTVFDTVISTVYPSPADAVGTLIADWDVVGGTDVDSPLLVRVVGISAWGDHIPTGLAPMTLDQILVRLVCHIECHPDTISGTTVRILPTIWDFSDPLGQLITPVVSTGAQITILPPVPGDQDFSGFVDAVDLGQFIDCIFANGCPRCDAVQTDFDCNGQPDAVDLGILIDYIFFSAAAPPHCP